MTQTELQTIYDDLKAQATNLAGELLDIPRRAVLLNSMYLDSGENHAFSLIAAHGALWAYKFFEVGGRLGRMISYRYFYDSRERAYRLGLLNHFAEGFRTVNRQVCIDTWTNYNFVRDYGREPGAERIIQPTLLDALNLVHDARKTRARLCPAQKRAVFEQSFRWEQELTVAPGVKKTVSEFECAIMVALCTKPIVRFSYFPRWQYLWFKDFSNKDERIDRGFRAYSIAERMGWDHVAASQQAYGLLSPEFFSSPREYSERVRQSAPLTVLA